jgi:biotin synthase
MMDRKHYRESRANSILTGDKLLTAANAGDDKDAAMLGKLGLVPMEAEEPMRSCRALVLAVAE